MGCFCIALSSDKLIAVSRINGNVYLSSIDKGFMLFGSRAEALAELELLEVEAHVGSEAHLIPYDKVAALRVVELDISNGECVRVIEEAEEA